MTNFSIPIGASNIKCAHQIIKVCIKICTFDATFDARTNNILRKTSKLYEDYSQWEDSHHNIWREDFDFHQNIWREEVFTFFIDISRTFRELFLSVDSSPVNAERSARNRGMASSPTGSNDDSQFQRGIARLPRGRNFSSEECLALAKAWLEQSEKTDEQNE
jgi:hypothetical protein